MMDIFVLIIRLIFCRSLTNSRRATPPQHCGGSSAWAMPSCCAPLSLSWGACFSWPPLCFSWMTERRQKNSKWLTHCWNISVFVHSFKYLIYFLVTSQQSSTFYISFTKIPSFFPNVEVSNESGTSCPQRCQERCQPCNTQKSSEPRKRPSQLKALKSWHKQFFFISLSKCFSLEFYLSSCLHIHIV